MAHDEMGADTYADVHTSALDVLIVSSYYWPERAGNAPYVTGFAEHLAGRGHRVTVATGFPHYPDWRSSPTGILGTREVHNGVELQRRRHYVPTVQSVRTRAAYEASLCALGATAMPRRAPDVVVGITPTLAGAVLARAAAALYRRPYGVIFQDLQGLGASESGVQGGGRIASLLERSEILLARQATAIGVIAGGFERYFCSHGIPAERIHRLPNWSQGPEPSETVADARSRLGWAPDEFICLHAGNMGHKQGLENVLHAAALIEDPAIRVVLAGGGNERARLEAAVQELGLSNVSFLPPQPSGLYEAMLRAADVLLVNQRASVSEMSLASKLTSYFMAARPVIGAVAEQSETALELERANAGLLTAPGAPSALATAIEWARTHVDEAEALGAQGRRYAEEHLRAEKVLERYEDFVTTISYGAPSRASRMRRERRPWESARRERGRVGVLGGVDDSTVVSILIVTYECREATLACLASIEGDRATLPLEVILVDNTSRDGTVAAVEERFPWVRVIANESNVGFAAAVNEALSLARGEYLLVLNPDTVVPPGAIEGAIAELERNPSIGMLGCKLRRTDGTFDHACKRGFPTVSSALYFFFGLHRLWPSSPRFAHYTAGALDSDEPGFVDAVNGAFMLVRRAAVEDVGPMDERYWLYAEDLDWCRRFWENGWKILYWPGAEVTHVKGGSTGDRRSWRLNLAFHRSMWLFYEKHHAGRHPPIFSALVWAGVWAKLGVSAAANAIARLRSGSPPAESSRTAGSIRTSGTP
jgi:GT2 family glycosyltransferase/glycosyltransferase involved in cell wall biosynthesis